MQIAFNLPDLRFDAANRHCVVRFNLIHVKHLSITSKLFFSFVIDEARPLAMRPGSLCLVVVPLVILATMLTPSHTLKTNLTVGYLPAIKGDLKDRQGLTISGALALALEEVHTHPLLSNLPVIIVCFWHRWTTTRICYQTCIWIYGGTIPRVRLSNLRGSSRTCYAKVFLHSSAQKVLATLKRSCLRLGISLW